jgi:hypothetical protein
MKKFNQNKEAIQYKNRNNVKAAFIAVRTNTGGGLSGGSVTSNRATRNLIINGTNTRVKVVRNSPTNNWKFANSKNNARYLLNNATGEAPRILLKFNSKKFDDNLHHLERWKAVAAPDSLRQIINRLTIHMNRPEVNESRRSKYNLVSTPNKILALRNVLHKAHAVQSKDAEIKKLYEPLRREWWSGGPVTENLVNRIMALKTAYNSKFVKK